jgi:O-antigen/teichoic acid export membrane protein
MYSPEQFGIFAIFTSVITLIPIFSSFRLEYAFFIKKQNIEYFFIPALLITVSVSLISSVILSNIIFDNLSFIVLFLGISLTSLYIIYSQFAIALKEYKHQSIARILQGFGQYFIVILMGLVCVNKGLVISFIVGQFLGILYLIYHIKINIHSYQWNKEKQILKENKDYCISSTLASILQYAVPLAPTLIGNLWYKTELIGTYFLVSQAIMAPSNLIRRPLLNIVTSELTTRDRFKISFIPFLCRISLVKIIFSIILLSLFIGLVYTFKEKIVIFVFGEKWVSGGIFLIYTCIYCVFDILLQPFSLLLNLWGKYRHVYIMTSLLFGIAYINSFLAGWIDLSFPIYIILHYSIIIVYYIMMTYFVFQIGMK